MTQPLSLRCGPLDWLTCLSYGFHRINSRASRQTSQVFASGEFANICCRKEVLTLNCDEYSLHAHTLQFRWQWRAGMMVGAAFKRSTYVPLSLSLSLYAMRATPCLHCQWRHIFAGRKQLRETESAFSNQVAVVLVAVFVSSPRRLCAGWLH